MTFAEQKTLLHRLSHEWALGTLTISQTTRLRTSRCWPMRRHIELSTHTTLGYRDVCYHEYAHIVAEARKPGYGHRHDKNFFSALVEILEKEGLIATYPWHREYPRIYQWARKEGYAETIDA
jgi:hypothetical protein